mgnify:CR=1 FL=1
MSRIALVDDDRNILTSVSMTLEAEGYDVETFNDGQAALDAFNKRLPDMAVLDIKMPRMDGMELLQRLRQFMLAARTADFSQIAVIPSTSATNPHWLVSGELRTVRTS